MKKLSFILAVILSIISSAISEEITLNWIKTTNPEFTPLFLRSQWSAAQFFELPSNLPGTFYIITIVEAYFYQDKLHYSWTHKDYEVQIWTGDYKPEPYKSTLLGSKKGNSLNKNAYNQLDLFDQRISIKPGERFLVVLTPGGCVSGGSPFVVVEKTKGTKPGLSDLAYIIMNMAGNFNNLSAFMTEGYSLGNFLFKVHLINEADVTSLNNASWGEIKSKLLVLP